MKEGRRNENGTIFIHGFVESIKKKKILSFKCIGEKKKKKKEINLSFSNEGYRKFASADV